MIPDKAIMELKAAARDEARQVRKRLAAEGGRIVAEALAQAALKLVRRLRPEGVIAGYWPKGSEADFRPALADLARAGYDLALPAVTAPDAPLVFRSWAPEDELFPDLLGMSAPHPDAPAVTPVLLFAPLLAFDVKGYRLGQGGGYYDRTLRTLGEGTAACGVAYSGQMVRSVPRDEWDVPLDHIITEQGVWDRAEEHEHGEGSS